MASNIESKLDDIHAMVKEITKALSLNVSDEASRRAEADRVAAEAYRPGGALHVAGYGDPNAPAVALESAAESAAESEEETEDGDEDQESQGAESTAQQNSEESEDAAAPKPKSGKK